VTVGSCDGRADIQSGGGSVEVSWGVCAQSPDSHSVFVSRPEKLLRNGP
jgi:hypothetical protein